MLLLNYTILVVIGVMLARGMKITYDTLHH